jgi:hypothetical protein
LIKEEKPNGEDTSEDERVYEGEENLAVARFQIAGNL